MSMLYASTNRSFKKHLAALLAIALLSTVLPAPVLAGGLDGADGADGVSVGSGTAPETPPENTDTGSSTDPVVDTGSSTDSGVENQPTDGEDGTEGTAGAEGAASSTASTTPESTGDEGGATTTATTTPESNDAGTDGSDGQSGSDGSDGGGNDDTGEGTGEQPAEDPGVPVTIYTDNQVGYDPTPNDGEGVTGDMATSGPNIKINTGPAVAQGEITNDANSSVVMSDTESIPNDLDIYTFNATGTNEADVDNDGGVFALTGNNSAQGSGEANIVTGEAVAALNIANVINSNVVNSDGYLYLKNEVLTPGQTLNLGDFFFPEEDGSLLAKAGDCTLLSCMAEDIIYNFSQHNEAKVSNDASVKAITGENQVGSEFPNIETGAAYAAANVVNVVNTNIVDSNYRMFTLNAMGDLDGDLILPTQELFTAFYSRPNGLSQTEDAEDITVTVTHDNDAQVANNVDSSAETGANNSRTNYDSFIKTGEGESESNILNKVNQNIYGGDSMYLLIRVHGQWSGDVYGLPDGLTWEWTPDGILIYNEGAEISPSVILPYDVDAYTATFSDRSTTTIDNNLTVKAITGDNEIDGQVGSITTGDAYASANVMNIANTNIVGTNFSMAVVNIFGDFDGDVTFSSTDVSVSGDLSSSGDPITAGSPVTYTYVVRNNSDVPATGVTLRHALNKAINPNGNPQTIAIGTLAAGASKTVTVTATVDPALGSGSHDVVATATVESNEADANSEDNRYLISKTITVSEPESNSGGGTSTGGNNSGGSNTSSGNSGVSSGSSSSGGGGSSSKTKNIDREQTVVDPDAAPFLVITKTADVAEDDTIDAGTAVEYTLTVRNTGGTAYDATVLDTLLSPIGGTLSTQTWDLGTVLSGEVIDIEYVTEYNADTPTGVYTNRAEIVAYRHEDSKAQGEDPLRLPDAEYTIAIDGIALAIGNVGPLLYFPEANGTVGILMSWETSTTSVSQMYYSPSTAFTVFNKFSPRYGYQLATNQFASPKANHFKIVKGLTRGTTYRYRIDAKNADTETVSREYTFFVPRYLAGPMLPQMIAAQPQVAGVATQAVPATLPPTPVTQAPRYTPPAPVAYTPPKPVVTPAPQPAPAPAPPPDPQPQPEQKSGGFTGLVKKVFSFF